MLDKRAWVRRRHDRIRRALMREPRGHADMYGAVLTEPVSPGAHAGVLFMHNEGYSTMCGHGVVAVVKIAVEEGLLSTIGEGGPGVSGARVSGARVSGARVSGARVSGARVSGARVSGARISGARGDAGD